VTSYGFAEGFAELQKAFHALSYHSSNTSLLASQYNANDTVIVNTPQVGGPNQANLSYLNAFVIAQDMEAFSNRSDIMLSGCNTLSQQVFFEATINTAPTQAYALDFFAQFDMLLVIDQTGIISVKF
jgi:hypothetical protein